MSDVTRILDELSDGDEQATSRLLDAVYGELRRLASDKLAHEAPGHTLQPTALVHEVYLRLIGDGQRDWKSRGYFFAACAEAMRRILVERARGKARLKRGGDRERVALEHAEPAVPPASIDLIALDEALEKLGAQDEAKATLVKLRYFTGLTQTDAARALGISRATADRHWAYARAWLFDQIKKGDTEGS